MSLYVGPHVDQFDGSTWASSNCVPTTGANGARNTTGGIYGPTGATVREKVKRSEETSPATPGWSQDDLDLAMRRLGIPFEVRTGRGWAGVLRALNAGLYVSLAGDSDVFGSATCSGNFDGDHCIGVHPKRSGTLRWINDPICSSGRWEDESVLRRYAEKLYSSIHFGAFLHPVPEQWPAEIGPRPAGASMWVQTDRLARVWEARGGVLRPIERPTPGAFTFTAWCAPNRTQTWAPGPKSSQRFEAVFRQILGPVHDGQYIRVTDMGCTWHHLI